MFKCVTVANKHLN